MTTGRYRIRAILGALVTVIALSTPAFAAPAAAATTGFEPLPSLPVHACHDAALPRDYGRNLPGPSDPNGFGFANQTAIGWEGNYYAPFAYLSGSYFARGVPDAYQPGGKGQSYCGAMYSFG